MTVFLLFVQIDYFNDIFTELPYCCIRQCVVTARKREVIVMIAIGGTAIGTVIGTVIATGETAIVTEIGTEIVAIATVVIVVVLAHAHAIGTAALPRKGTTCTL